MEALPATARVNRVLNLSKYDVLEEIGHGGMATVYRAHDRRLARDVAIKIIHPHLRDSPEIAHRFFMEAKAVAKLRHPNIVEVYDVSREDETEQYLVVELVRGLTLRKLLQKHGTLPPEVAAGLALELLNALAHAHKAGVIHRDIKPENVLIEHLPLSPAPDADKGEKLKATSGLAGDCVRVKLADFGIAKLLDAQGVTSTGQVLGSPAHMAPEQIEGGNINARSDVFGLGVLLYEAMVGHLPFEGNNPAQVLRRVLDGIYSPAERERPTVGKIWSQMLDQALAREPEARFAGAVSMRDAVRSELDRLGFGSPREELERWCDAPSLYAEQHTKRMLKTLCDRASETRKKGDLLAAANDYNRALAYAPNDATLLKLVGRMHQAEKRTRLLKTGGRIAAIALALGGGGLSL